MAEGDPITVVNDSDTKLVFCDFNAGDQAVPFEHTWVDPHSKGKLPVGNFKSLSVGVQVQLGGVWIGGEPKDPPYATPGSTFTFTIQKKIS